MSQDASKVCSWYSDIRAREFYLINQNSDTKMEENKMFIASYLLQRIQDKY
jgi:hypothetical protein